MLRKTVKTLLTLCSVLAAALITGVTPAHAADRDGFCNDGEFCYYYNSNNTGSISDFLGSGAVANYGASQPSCYEFRGAGAGRRQCIKNNAASVWNRSKQSVRVYFNSYLAGNYQNFAPGARGNLNPTLKNNNASHMHFTATAPSPPPAQVAPYFKAWQDGPGHIHHHAYVTFKASDLHNGRHVKRVYVRIQRQDCWLWPDGDTGQVLSASAKSPSDTTTYKVYTHLYDSPNFYCPMRSYWGVAEYF